MDDTSASALAPAEQDGSLRLPSGRTLAWTVFGGPFHAPAHAADAAPPNSGPAPNPAVLFHFHGFPGSRLEVRMMPPSLYRDLNFRCVAIDRPGMGRSSFDAHRRVTDWPADVLAVADHLEISKFYVMGVSGGAPYALACAKDIPWVDHVSTAGTESKDAIRPTATSDATSSEAQAAGAGAGLGTTEAAAFTSRGKGRLRGVALVCGAYPPALGLEGMFRGMRILYFAGAWLPRAFTSVLLDLAMGRAARDTEHPAALEQIFDKEMAGRPAIEQKPYADANVRTSITGGVREAFRQGGKGVATDLMLLNDWGFDLHEIRDAKGVRLWHGKLDTIIPFAMAEKAAALMPAATRHFRDEEGHLGLAVNCLEEIFRDLLLG